MLSLDAAKLKELQIPVDIAWLLGSCMEARGKQHAWLTTKPHVLELLREQAIIQSVESSNRLEGVTVPTRRLRELLIGQDRPRNRSEEEIVGYEKALKWIFTRKRSIHLKPSTIQNIHAMAMGKGARDAGKWRHRNSEVIEILPSGERRVRFDRTPTERIPILMSQLCENYFSISYPDRIPALLIIAGFIFDLLRIHPFCDGNSQVLLLTNTLLLKCKGYEVARYISMERLVEERRDEFFEVLAKCSQQRHHVEDVIYTWWRFYLSLLLQAYEAFETAVNAGDAHMPKSDMIRQEILDHPDEFTLADMSTRLPSVSSQLIKKVLSDLKRESRVKLSGRGRSARWRVVRR